jgi:hypothetical protein
MIVNDMKGRGLIKIQKSTSKVYILSPFQYLKELAKNKLRKFKSVLYTRSTRSNRTTADSATERPKKVMKIQSLDEQYPNIEEMEMAQPISKIERKKEVTPEHKARKRA